MRLFLFDFSVVYVLASWMRGISVVLPSRLRLCQTCL